MTCRCLAITVAAAAVQGRATAGDEAWASKRGDWFYERLFGARSAAGSMTPLSQEHVVARTQIPVAPLPHSRPRCPLSSSGLSCFLLPTSLCSRQREVGAAPHRGNANRPLTIQGKAKAPEHGQKAPRRQKNAQNQTHIVRQIKNNGFPLPCGAKNNEAVNTVSDKPLAASEKARAKSEVPTLTDHLAKAKAKAKAKTPLL